MSFCLPTSQTRLQELEKALEEKENEVLRNLKPSQKNQARSLTEGMTKSNPTSLSTNHSEHLKRCANCPEVQNASTSMASKENNSVVDLETDSYLMDEDCLRLSPEKNQHLVPDSDIPATNATSFSNPEDLSANPHIGRPWSPGIKMKSDENGISERIITRKVTHTSSTWTTETLIIDDISKQTPSYVVKKEAPTCDSAACPGESISDFMKL